MDAEPNLDDAPPTKRMKITPPIHLLPNELLVKIIDKLPRPQWPSLELVDHKFRDAVLLAWGSVREVDIERDFIYSELKPIKDVDSYSTMAATRLRRQIARKTESILKKLTERSPFITSLIGVSLIRDDPNLNRTAVQYLTRFEYLESIQFARKYFTGRIVNGRELCISCDIPLISLVQFMESTQSRTTLKVIDIEQCHIPSNSLVVAANYDRLRAAFINDSNDPTRPLLQLVSFSMRIDHINSPLTFVDNIDPSRMTTLSLGDSPVESATLTTLINGAPQLRHLDFAFLQSCGRYDNTPVCQGGRLQANKDLLAALESHPNLTSLGFNMIWYWKRCACHGYETEFKKMLRTIAPRLVNFVFKPKCLPPDIRMGEFRDIIQHHMPCLKSIKLDERCAEDPEELRGIADGKELEEIEIDSFLYNDNYRGVLNEVMSTIIKKSPRLKKFSCFNYLPDQRAAVELCKLSDLIDLRIQAGYLTKENFVAFSKQVFAEKLQILRLNEIGRGVETGLIELIKKATQLRELHVDQNVSDRLLECLAESCPKLEKFNARWAASGFTFDSVQLLVDRCPNLRWLHVGNVDRNLTDLKLDRYRELELH